MSPDLPGTLAFRLNINPLLWLAAGIAAVGPVGYVVLSLLRSDSRTFDSTDFLLSSLASGAVGTVVAALAMVLRHWSTVRASPAGLHCDGRGRRTHFIEWRDMLTVMPSGLEFGLRYLLIRVPLERDWIMLPLFLEDMPRFVDTVEKFAGSDHALVKELREVMR
jgi:hypothetical protein